ncbi:MAG TPA: hypothetical protein VE912_00340, partial [Bacteroidales bacterium]|nr:hypothetical protein [Bacteroidales bacterium]
MRILKTYIVSFIVCSVLLSTGGWALGQPVNEYIKVKRVLGFDKYNADSIVVNSSAGIETHDTILLFQMSGIEIDASDQVANLNSSGNYEFLLVGSVPNDSVVIFASPLARTYNDNELIQAIKVPGYKNYTTTKDITVPKWDGSIGGILALIVSDTLFLYHDIDVSGSGFRGASLDTVDFPNVCASNLSGYDKNYYLEDASDTAAHKGEGAVIVSFPYTRGKRFVQQGGGGGNGRFSGGGGGGNFGKGGRGGREYQACSDSIAGGQGGGLFPNSWYSNTQNSVYMGGGGGTSTQNLTLNKFATAGANGGGIVIIMARVLAGNGHIIKANGGSIIEVATAGGGGGGGGGAIILDAGGIIGTVTLQVKGGKGGDSNFHDGERTGSGGGGGGGIIWLREMQTEKLDASGGLNGDAYPDYRGYPGNPGTLFTGLKIPLTGFLYNILSADQVICQNTVPVTIEGSEAKGGDGNYSYEWIQSVDLSVWSTIIGASGPSYQPPALSDTTFYRRIVTSHLPDLPLAEIVDTSRVMAVNVIPAIQNNAIAGDDTVCFNDAPVALKGSGTLSGGYQGYTYQWISQTTGATTWNNEGSNQDSLTYQPPPLTLTTRYRRVVTSYEVCVDTSNEVEVTVLDTISNNIVAADHIICNNDQPDKLTGNALSGGDGTYSLFWQQSNTGTNWSTIPGTTDEADYLPPVLHDTTYYRRIALSGSQDACIDTSNHVVVDVLSSLTNNSISSSQLLCENDTAETLNGVMPDGGDGSY